MNAGARKALKPRDQALWQAAHNWRFDDCLSLLDGTTPNVKGADGLSALHFACAGGRLDLVQALTKRGWSMALPDSMGNTPVRIASRNGETEVVLAFWPAGTAAQGELLQTACGNGRVATAKAILERGVSVEARNGRDGQTPLYTACESGHLEVARLLLDRGADIEATCHSGQRSLMIAASCGYLDCLWELIAAGCELDATEAQGMTALLWAVEASRAAAVDHVRNPGTTGMAEIVGVLLEAGADPDIRPHDGPDARQRAVELHDLALMDVFAAHDARKRLGNMLASDRSMAGPIQSSCF